MESDLKIFIEKRNKDIISLKNDLNILPEKRTEYIKMLNNACECETYKKEQDIQMLENTLKIEEQKVNILENERTKIQKDIKELENQPRQEVQKISNDCDNVNIFFNICNKYLDSIVIYNNYNKRFYPDRDKRHLSDRIEINLCPVRKYMVKNLIKFLKITHFTQNNIEIQDVEFLETINKQLQN